MVNKKGNQQSKSEVMTIKKNESPAGADGHGLMDCTIGLEMGRCAVEVDGGRWTVDSGIRYGLSFLRCKTTRAPTAGW